MSDENINPETGVDEGEPVNVAKMKAASDICKAAKAYERGVLNTSELIEIASRKPQWIPASDHNNHGYYKLYARQGTQEWWLMSLHDHMGFDSARMCARILKMHHGVMEITIVHTTPIGHVLNTWAV